MKVIILISYYDLVVHELVIEEVSD